MWFVEPIALLFTGLYGVLVLFYLWERWRRRVTVPSLLLWQDVREDTIRARRFRPDLLFVLQLLLLTCLIVGLAKPYFTGQAGGAPRQRHIVVLDTTASMQAREGRGSRFEEARDAARALVATLDAHDEVMLIAAGHAPEVVLTFTRDHAAVAQALEEVAPADTGGDLEVALAFAEAARQRSDLPVEVDVFTDVPRAQLRPPLRDQVTVFQVGESDDNIGIQALQIFQGRFQDYRTARAQVLVQNYGHREGHGSLTVQLGDQIVSRSGFSLGPREAKGFMVHDFPAPGVVVARLDVADALAADNAAYGWIRPAAPVRVLLVSADSPLVTELRALAAATPALDLAVVDPAQLSPAQTANADIAIFHRFVPATPPPLNALYIHPDTDNRLFPVETEVANIEVFDWNAAHPALASLRPLVALPLRGARVVTPPPWSQVLLWSRTDAREFPLALAGEHDGQRVACITFDLEGERLLSTDNLNMFLFFMNLLAWLAPDTHDALVVNTGDVRALGPFPVEPVRVRDPHGTNYTLAGSAPTLEPLFAGEYRVSSDGTRQTVFANFIDPVESDIGRASKEPPIVRSADRPAGRSQAAAPHAAAQSSYGAWFYGVALALLLIEWVVVRRASA